MANSYFQFKEFIINQNLAAMKVGTDGVLLGAWCRIESWQKRILDIGTGTGLIALMVAQRSEKLAAVSEGDVSLKDLPLINLPMIDAVEIDDRSYCQAVENFGLSRWGSRLKAVPGSLQSFCGGGDLNRCDSCADTVFYDHIISNPPYFNNSLRSVDSSRTMARHTLELTYSELAAGISCLLSDRGIASLIIPYSESARLIGIFVGFGLCPSRLTEVCHNVSKAPKRIMIEFVREGSVEISPIRTRLVIEGGERYQYTEEYKKLTEDFYL